MRSCPRGWIEALDAIRLGFRNVLEDRQRALVQRLAALGQRQPPRGPVEQPGAEKRLQFLDIARDVGGRGVQRIGGAGEAAPGDDRREDLEGPQAVHGAPDHS